MAVPIAGRGPEVLGVISLFIVLTTTTIALRIYCRSIVGKGRGNFGWDDTFAVVAWVSIAEYMCCFRASRADCWWMTGIFHRLCIYDHYWSPLWHRATRMGHPSTVGHPNWVQGQFCLLRASELVADSQQYTWLCENLYVISNMAIKASIGVMLLRVVISPTHRMILWATLIITEVYSAGFFLYFVFQCSPPRYFWTRVADGQGSCVKPSITIGLFYGYSVVLCLGDWIYAVLPSILVWRLRMPIKQKILVGMILALGAIATAATIARFPYIEGMSNSEDFLYATTDVAIWSSAETGLAITAAGCATLRPLFRTWFNKSSADASGRSSHGYQKAPTPRAEMPLSPAPYPDGKFGYTVGIESDPHEAGAATEMDDRRPQAGIRVNQQGSTSFESVAPSMSSTAKIMDPRDLRIYRPPA